MTTQVDFSQYGLGERRSFDTRSRAYPVRPLLLGLTPQNKRWPCYVRLDQGNTPRCVGYACAAELAAEPVVIPNVTNVSGDNIYFKAQTLDEWPGEAYDGTSVLGGMKALQDYKYIGEYRWAFGIDDFILALSNLGPVVVGTNWYNSMFTPDNQGQIHIDGVAGNLGHSYCFDEFDVDHNRAWFVNSWNRGWGIDGRAWFAISDFAMLLNQGGVASIITQRFDPASPTPVQTVRMEMGVQPSNTIIGVKSPNYTVIMRKADGAINEDDTSSVLMTLVGDDGRLYSNTKTVNAIRGIATFEGEVFQNLHPEGLHYHFTRTGIPDINSNSFKVLPVGPTLIKTYDIQVFNDGSITTTRAQGGAVSPA